MRVKRKILDEEGIRRALTRIAYEIIEKNTGGSDLVLVGIQRRGGPLADRISQIIAGIEGIELPVAELDISPYRDDREAMVSNLGEEKILPFKVKKIGGWFLSTMCSIPADQYGRPWMRLFIPADAPPCRFNWQYSSTGGTP